MLATLTLGWILLPVGDQPPVLNAWCGDVLNVELVIIIGICLGEHRPISAQFVLLSEHASVSVLILLVVVIEVFTAFLAYLLATAHLDHLYHSWILS